MTYGSLFSGIGGMDLGLDRAGWECAFQVEISDYCRRVLAKHWPHVPKYADIREVTGEQLGYVDLLAGGFPCQDVSEAGKRAGIDGARSGLWSEFARLVGEIRPRVALVENTPGLLRRGMGRVLGDLAALGYNAEWSVLSACAMGAPHPRERVFIVAYAQRAQWRADHTQERDTQGEEFLQCQDRPETPGAPDGGCQDAGWWAVEPGLDRVAHGAPARLDRLKGLGNAVVPQVAEWIGRRILEAAQ